MEGNSAIAIATNGFTLCKYNLNLPCDVNTGEYTLSNTLIDVLLILAKKSTVKDIQINASNEKLKFSIDRYTVLQDLNSSTSKYGQFPDYRNVCPKETDLRYYIDIKSTLKAIDTILPLNKLGVAQLANDAILFTEKHAVKTKIGRKTTTEYINGETHAVPANISINYNPVLVPEFNLKLLKTILSCMPSSKQNITMESVTRVGNSPSPHVIHMDNATFIIMPLRKQKNHTEFQTFYADGESFAGVMGFDSNFNACVYDVVNTNHRHYSAKLYNQNMKVA